MSQPTLPLAVQLYSLREYEGSLDSMLTEVAAAGYAAVETVGTQGSSATELAQLLEKHGLSVCSSHVSLQALQENLSEVVKFHEAVDNFNIVVPWVPNALYDDSKESWQNLGKQLSELGAKLKAHKMQLHYHNHAFEMVRIDGKLGLEWMLDSASPENLMLEPDLAWFVRGQADPLLLLEKYAGRILRAHVKDIAPEGENQDEGGWADVGAGTLDWASLLPAAKGAGAQWYIVEHDKPKDPIATIRNSAAYLKDELI